MRGATQFAVVSALALALGTGCEAVKGVNDAGDDDDDVVDAGGPDAVWERGTVTVEVRGPDGVPLQGVRIIFNEPDGSVASTQNTTSDGRASFDLFPQSYVSIAFTEGDLSQFYLRHNVRTIAGVRPGDNILVSFRDDNNVSNEYMGDLRMDLRTNFAGATSYELRVGCDTFTTGAIGQIDWSLFKSSCNGGLEPVDVVVTARNDAYEPIAFSTHAGVALNAASYTAVNTWRTDWSRLTINLTNPPDGLSAAQTEMAVWRRGLDYGLGEPPFAVVGSTGATFDLLFPPSFAERLQPRLISFYGSFPDSINGFLQHQRQLNAGDNEVTINLGTDLLPRVEEVVFEPNGLVNSEISFAVLDPGGFDAVAGAGSIQWEQTIPGDAGNPDTRINWEWFFLMPPDQQSPLRLPIVPAGSLPDGAWPPPEAATMNSALVGYVDTTLASSWDEFRTNDGFEMLGESMGPNVAPGSYITLTVGGLIGFD